MKNTEPFLVRLSPLLCVDWGGGGIQMNIPVLPPLWRHPDTVCTHLKSKEQNKSQFSTSSSFSSRTSPHTFALSFVFQPQSRIADLACPQVRRLFSGLPQVTFHVPLIPFLRCRSYFSSWTYFRNRINRLLLLFTIDKWSRNMPNISEVSSNIWRRSRDYRTRDKRTFWSQTQENESKFVAFLFLFLLALPFRFLASVKSLLQAFVQSAERPSLAVIKKLPKDACWCS